MRLRCLLTKLEFREVRTDVLVISACVYLPNYLINVEDLCPVLSDDEYKKLTEKFPDGDGHKPSARIFEFLCNSGWS